MSPLPANVIPVSAPDATERPLRADAERNRQRILAAAAALFAERGVDVSIDDIAAAAGVGIGTVYRRFPDREALIEALFEDKLARHGGDGHRRARDRGSLGGLRDLLPRRRRPCRRATAASTRCSCPPTAAASASPPSATRSGPSRAARAARQGGGRAPRGPRDVRRPDDAGGDQRGRRHHPRRRARVLRAAGRRLPRRPRAAAATARRRCLRRRSTSSSSRRR